MVSYVRQPFNSAQTWKPNWYNVNYRRTGTYKGFGQGGIDPYLASDLAAQAGILPGETSVSANLYPYGVFASGGTNITGNVSTPSMPGAPAATLGGATYYPSAPAGAGTGTLTQYLPWILGGGVLLIVILAARR